MSTLNRARGIEWIHPDPDRRWSVNPLGTWCLNGCEYCYGRRFAQRVSCPKCRANQPHEHLDRLPALAKAKPGDGVFVCSCADLWSDGVEPGWRREIIMAARETAATHYILTKRPDRIRPEDWDIPFGGEDEFGCAADKIVMGTSVTGNRDVWRIDELVARWPGRKMISLEPLLGDDAAAELQFWGFKIDYVVIGGLSGSWLPAGYDGDKEALQHHQARWAARIIDVCRYWDIPVLVKTKPARIPLPADYQIQQWITPKEA